MVAVEDDPTKVVLYGPKGFPIAIAHKFSVRPNFAEQSSENPTLEYGFGVNKDKTGEALRSLADMVECGAIVPQSVTHSTKAILDDFTLQLLTLEFAAPRALNVTVVGKETTDAAE